MKKIFITDEERRGKSAVEAAPLFLEAMRKLDESEKEVRLIVPSIWSWTDLPMQVIQFNMFELARSLVVEFGENYVFNCHYDAVTKELSITAQHV